MAKGSVRKKGKKWYARFYIEDESGRKVQKEFVGTESKSETEALLRKAIADYEEKKFVAKSENITVGMLLDLWVEEELKPGNLSNGTVMSYQGTVNRIKQHPIGNRKLKTVTADHLQAYIDFLSFGGTNPDGTTAKALSKGYLRLFSAVLQGAFRFAVFPKRLIAFNPMQYVVWRGKKEEYELFSDEDGETASTPWRLKKKTAPIMRFTVCRGRRRSQQGTRNYPLSALDLMGHLKHRVRWGLCAGQREKRWRDWRTSTSICSDTLIQAICFQTVQHLKMCRNFSDTLMSVPQ